MDFDYFEFPNGETALTTSLLLHGDANPNLVKNEEVEYYTLTIQVLLKIILFDLLPRSGKYSHARGNALLLNYCLLKGIRVNIPKLLMDFLFFDHLMIPSRNLSNGMIITYFLKHFKIDLSGKTVYPPSVDIDRTL